MVIFSKMNNFEKKVCMNYRINGYNLSPTQFSLISALITMSSS